LTKGDHRKSERLRIPRYRWLIALSAAGALCLLVAIMAYELGWQQGALGAARAATATAAASGPPHGTVPAGMVAARVTRIVDGDTIKVDIDGREFTVRYIGINTPETKAPNRPVEPFGPEAAAANERLVAGEVVFLEKDVSETDNFGRLLRYVWLDGIMVNEELVREGYARVSTFPPDVKYAERLVQAEQEARKAAKGLWSMVTPTPIPTPTALSRCPGGCLTPPPGCLIKGNITGDGRRIFHLPDSPYYERTKIDPEAGERWFCNPSEAEAAGWQASSK